VKTDELIEMLASGAEAVPAHAARGRMLAAVALGLPVSVLAVGLLFGLRHDLLQAAHQSVLWIKMAIGVAVALAAAASLRRLSSPGVPAGRGWTWGAAALAVLWTLGALQWASLSDTARWQSLFGDSWRVCPLNIAMVSVPIFIAVVLALRGIAAPTHPARAGAAAGLLAGGLGTMAYALHCPETGVPFVAVWYVLGMVAVGGVGAMLGPRLFRW